MRVNPLFTIGMNAEMQVRRISMVMRQRFPKKSDHKCNTPDHQRYPSAEFIYEVLRRCFELGENVEYVSGEIGCSRMGIYT